MSKDQAIGGTILAVCAVVIAGYLVLVGVPQLFGLAVTTVRLDAVLVLVSVGFVAILAIGGWIGFTMATTPPAKPIEDLMNENARPQTSETPESTPSID